MTGIEILEATRRNPQAFWDLVCRKHTAITRSFLYISLEEACYSLGYKRNAAGLGILSRWLEQQSPSSKFSEAIDRAIYLYQQKVL